MLSPDLQTHLHVKVSLEYLSFSHMRFRSTENLEPYIAKDVGVGTQMRVTENTELVNRTHWKTDSGSELPARRDRNILVSVVKIYKY